MNQFINAGVGSAFRAVEGETGNLVIERTIIEPGECTEVAAAHVGQELMFYIEFDNNDDTSGSGSEEVASTEETLFIDRVRLDLSAYDQHDSINVDGLNSYSWGAGRRMLGLYRVRNGSARPITVYSNAALL